MKIRSLQTQDFEPWSVLWQDYLAFYETTRPYEVYRLAFERMLDPARPQQFGGVAVQADGSLVGLVHNILHAHNWSAEDVLYLQDLFVAPDARGTGAGRALIEWTYERARARGLSSVYWMTQEFNYTGRMLYDRVAERTPFIKYAKTV